MANRVNRKPVKKKRKMNPRIFLVAGVVIIAMVIVMVLNRAPGTKAGMDYLQKQSKLKVDDISSDLKAIKKEERKKAVSDGKMDATALLDDFVFYGDSRVMGFISYGFYDENIIFSGTGYTLANVDEFNDRLEQIMPGNVIISYGINDLGLQWDLTYEGGYGQMLTDKMDLIRSIDPNCHIYVCEIIPCAPYRLEESPTWKEEPAYNKKLTQACEAYENCTMVPTAALANGGNADIYSGDGVHFTNSFYYTWIQAIADAWVD